MHSAAVVAATTPLLLHQFHWAEVDKWQPLVNIPEPPVGWLVLLLLLAAASTSLSYHVFFASPIAQFG